MCDEYRSKPHREHPEQSPQIIPGCPELPSPPAPTGSETVVRPHRAELMPRRDHLTVNHRFQSDLHPDTREGLVPVSDRDKNAVMPLLILIANHAAEHKHGDDEFARDVLDALIYQHGVKVVWREIDIIRFDNPLMLSDGALRQMQKFARACAYICEDHRYD